MLVVKEKDLILHATQWLLVTVATDKMDPVTYVIYLYGDGTVKPHLRSTAGVSSVRPTFGKCWSTDLSWIYMRIVLHLQEAPKSLDV